MFPNLNAEMARKDMTMKSLSEETNITYDSMKNKMKGKTEFTLSEMNRIKDKFPGCSMDYLFEYKEDKDSEEV